MKNDEIAAQSDPFRCTAGQTHWCTAPYKDARPVLGAKIALEYSMKLCSTSDRTAHIGFHPPRCSLDRGTHWKSITDTSGKGSLKHRIPSHPHLTFPLEQLEEGTTQQQFLQLLENSTGGDYTRKYVAHTIAMQLVVKQHGGWPQRTTYSVGGSANAEAKRLWRDGDDGRGER